MVEVEEVDDDGVGTAIELAEELMELKEPDTEEDITAVGDVVEDMVEMEGVGIEVIVEAPVDEEPSARAHICLAIL